MGLMATLFSTVLAIPVSFLAAHNIMSRFAGGTAIYYRMRGILNVVRAIDTIVWGLIVIVWVGLGTFRGRYRSDDPLRGLPGKIILRRDRTVLTRVLSRRSRQRAPT